MHGTPGCNWCIGFTIIPSFDLSRPINVESSLPFVDILSQDVAFVLHLPDGWQDGCTLWNLGPEHEREVVSLQLSIHLLQHGLDKFMLVQFLHGLMQIHGIWII